MVNDKQFILNQNWPMWPFLPLKRKNNSLEEKNLGILFAGKEWIVFHVYLFDIKNVDFKTCPRTEYTSLDDLLADGWMVD